MKKIILVLLAIFILSGCSVFQKENNVDYSQCSDFSTVECYNNNNKITAEKILCSKDSDCLSEKMNIFCSPGYANMLECIGAKYFCGDDGYCKGCDCPIDIE